jgi:GxxExxY protein
MLEASREAEELARKVIGAAIEVHRHLGPGLLEFTYEEALAIELRLRGIPFARQLEQDVHYKGQCIATCRLDLLVGGLIVVELKAVESITAIHVAQTVAYLAITGLELGLILNFNRATLKDGVRRVIRTEDPEDPFASSRLRVIPARGSDTQ